MGVHVHVCVCACVPGDDLGPAAQTSGVEEILEQHSEGFTRLIVLIDIRHTAYRGCGRHFVLLGLFGGGTKLGDLRQHGCPVSGEGIWISKPKGCGFNPPYQ